MTRKDIQDTLELMGVHPDKIVMHKDGTVSVKRGYFYHHGKTAEGWAERVLKPFPTAILVEAVDEWREWPQDSYLVARIKLVETSRGEEK